MKEDRVLEYIRATANEEPRNLVAINAGLSPAEKYRITLGDRAWMVKLLPGDSKRVTWYRELNRCANGQMANPQMYKLFDDGCLCLLSPWIAGENLASCLLRATPGEVCDYGIQAAQILLHLHRATVEHPAYARKLTERILTACGQVESLGLTFPGAEECCAFLRREAATHHPGPVSFVHRDVRPENFLVCAGQLYLVDFDNGSLGERASDFAYLTTMVMPEHKLFSKALTQAYLQKVDIPSFWGDNLLYSTLQVVEYAIWKWNTKGRQVYFQADNLLRQYDGLTPRQPRWWQKI